MIARTRHIFRQRRPASARLESIESFAFGRAMYDENAAEARRNRPYDLDAADWEVLGELVVFQTTIVFDGVRLPVVEALCPWSDPAAFDSAVCRAGLKRFIRPAMESDMPAAVELGLETASHFVVQEMAAGIRIRRPIVWNPR